MPEIGHLKIAIASNSLTHADVTFALAKQILFYDVTYDTSEFIDVVRFSGGAGGAVTEVARGGLKNGGDCWMMTDAETTGSAGDRITPRVEATRGCHVVFTKGLSDLAAVRLHEHKIFPVKLESVREIDFVISALQKMMNSAHPPLWLRKALGYGTKNSDYLVDKAA